MWAWAQVTWLQNVAYDELIKIYGLSIYSNASNTAFPNYGYALWRLNIVNLSILVMETSVLCWWLAFIEQISFVIFRVFFFFICTLKKAIHFFEKKSESKWSALGLT